MLASSQILVLYCAIQIFTLSISFSSCLSSKGSSCPRLTILYYAHLCLTILHGHGGDEMQEMRSDRSLHFRTSKKAMQRDSWGVPVQRGKRAHENCARDYVSNGWGFKACASCVCVCAIHAVQYTINALKNAGNLSLISWVDEVIMESTSPGRGRL